MNEELYDFIKKQRRINIAKCVLGTIVLCVGSYILGDTRLFLGITAIVIGYKLV